MRSDLCTFLPTLELLGAVLKKIRLKTHTQKNTPKIKKKTTVKACGTVVSKFNVISGHSRLQCYGAASVK